MNRYKIKGIHCGSCSKLIQLELEESDFNNINVDQENEELVVPDEYKDQIEEIKQIVSKAGEYELVLA